VLPARRIVPVVRSDGSGTTAQFSTWMSKQYPALWNAYCARAGRSTPCGVTSNYPVIPGSGFTAQSGSLGVSGYVAQSQNEGTITYVEYSYALNTGFPVAKVLNRGGYYTEPTASNVAVGLLKARINSNASSADYLTQVLDGVYNGSDSRTYPLSSYSYMIVPTAVQGSFSTDKGRTLAAFAYYFLCQGQQQAPVLGYSPLPINLVRAGFDQVRRIPGVEVAKIDIKKCDNPTFSSDGTNTLARNAPRPPACDRQGAVQCETGTGGARRTPTRVTNRGGGTTAGASGTPAGQAAAGAGAGTATAAGPGTGAAAGGPTAAGAAVAGAAIDPDTGQAIASGAGAQGAGDAVGAVPVGMPLESDRGLQRSLMVLCALLLLAVTVGPPLVSRRMNRGSGP
jgi:PBP superfamily domain